MTNYLITVSYDGAGFCGWQSQPNAASVQSAVEEAVRRVFGERVSIVGSGRTDAGVHAIGQCANFCAEKFISPEKIPAALNFYLPTGIRVRSARVVPDGFNARKSAKRKTYMYLMYTGAVNAVLEGKAVRVEGVNVLRMREAAEELIGRHDFSSFVSSGGSAKTFTRTIFSARVEEEKSDFSDSVIKFYVTADGFLYNMVRIITAKLIEIGKGSGESMRDCLNAKNRLAAKGIAPACGLYLLNVDYGELCS